MSADELYVGLISGTSADGIDAALVSLRQDRPELIAHHLHPIPAATRKLLVSLFTPDRNQIDLMGELDIELGRLFAAAANTLLQQAGVPASAVQAIGSHGQTIRHRPDNTAPFTLQIGDPHTISQLTGLPVVADFRRRDMACGGQGAPLAPLFHQHCLTDSRENRVILNLGGIANITLLPARGSGGRPLAMDTGPASGLMDAWCQAHRNQPYDQAGAWAAQGQVIAPLLESWLQDPYFSHPAPKSTGKEYFHLEWAQQKAGMPLGDFEPVDVQATLLALTATTIMDAVNGLPVRANGVLVCGGGVHNQVLMDRLRALCPCPLDTTSPVGVDPDWVEAMCFAWLAKCHIDGTKLDTGPFTGAHSEVLLGALYPA